MPRSTLEDGYFHIVARGVFDTRIFRVDGDRRDFLDLLEASRQRQRWTLHAYCLMDTHYHVVVGSTQLGLSNGLCQLNGRHARRFNRRHARYGHLFAERFTARRIESETYLYDACSYVVLNPVKAGLCNRAEEWPWSYTSFGV